MPQPTTAEEWLVQLSRELDKRAPTIKKMRSYCDGNAPLPEMGRNLRASWEAFQKKARVNYGGLTCRALKNRIRPLGVTVGEGRGPAHAAAERIYRDTRFASQLNLAIEDRLETGWGYLAIGLDGNGKAVVTREKPEFFVATTDPLQPWKVVAALKVWRDRYGDVDHAKVWMQGQRQEFVRDSQANGVTWQRAASSTWKPVGDPETYDGAPPIVAIPRPDGVSLIAEHTDAIDAINLGKLNRLVIIAMQAFRQRALKAEKESDGLPSKDEDGSDIDYSKVFEPAPGALWELPSGIDIWESEATDIRPLLEGEKADRRDYAATTSTPLSVFMPEGENQSAEGSANAKEGHVSLAMDEIDEIRPAAAMAMVHALRAEGVVLADTDTVEIPFAPPARVSESEQWAAASAAKNAGMPLRTIMREVLGWSPAKIRATEADLSAQQLDALFAAPNESTAGAGAA